MRIIPSNEDTERLGQLLDQSSEAPSSKTTAGQTVEIHVGGEVFSGKLRRTPSKAARSSSRIWTGTPCWWPNPTRGALVDVRPPNQAPQRTQEASAFS